MSKDLNVLGVCNGQGIGLYTFHIAPRFNVLGNIEPRGEYFSPKNEQWEENFKGIPLWRNLDSIESKVKSQLRYDTDIIIGNPKCGGNSILRLSKNKSFKCSKEIKQEISLTTFIKSVDEFNPKIFLMENLPKLLENIDEEEWQYLIFPNYDLGFWVGSVNEFGNSQNSRVRLIIFGVRKDCQEFNIMQFIKIYPVRELRSTRELLNGLENTNRGNVREEKTKTLAMYDYRKGLKKLSVEEIQKLWQNDFNLEYKWPIKSKTMNTLPGVYRNRDDSYPMTARKADRQFKENGLPMSPRELARIMGIPDSFKIYVGPNEQYWINKGRLIVTQTFPYEIGLWFKRTIQKAITEYTKNPHKKEKEK